MLLFLLLLPPIFARNLFLKPFAPSCPLFLFNEVLFLEMVVVKITLNVSEMQIPFL